MLTHRLLFRIAGPTLLVSLLSLGSCVTAAVYLDHRQAAALQDLHENIRGRQIASDLAVAAADLIARPGENPIAADDLGKRIDALLTRADQAAGSSEEAQLVTRLRGAIGRYVRQWEAGTAAGGGDLALDRLGAEVLSTCRSLEQFEGAEIERSEAVLRRTVTETALGLAGMGLIGALVGIVSGYAVARSLGRAVLRAGELAEVGQIAAGMAHELRNPLTSIKMLVQVDRERAEARGLPSEDLFAIEQEIRRMEARLNAFMDFARPPRPERRLLDLSVVVDQTIALISGRASKQRVALRFERPGAPVLVEADGEQIRQLLVNLALNALDVMPRGGILEIQLELPADGQVRLCVRDTGPGVEPGHLSRLYEPFFTSKETGLGLGLAVSQRIARDHAGSLRAENRPEGGACFSLHLPAYEPS